MSNSDPTLVTKSQQSQPSSPPAAEQRQHVWIENDKRFDGPYCSECCVVRRADGKNSPCKGRRVTVTPSILREEVRRPDNLRLAAIQRALKGERLFDAELWARTNGVTVEAAEQELERRAREGWFEKLFLYEGSDSPVTFVVTEDLLDKPILLSQIPDFSEAEDREVMVSRFRSRPVYAIAEAVSPGG